MPQSKQIRAICYAFGHYSVRVPYVLVDVVLIVHVPSDD